MINNLTKNITINIGDKFVLKLEHTEDGFIVLPPEKPISTNFSINCLIMIAVGDGIPTYYSKDIKLPFMPMVDLYLKPNKHKPVAMRVKRLEWNFDKLILWCSSDTVSDFSALTSDEGWTSKRGI